MAVERAELIVAEHEVSGGSSFILSCTGSGGEALLSTSPQGHQEQSRQGWPGWHHTTKSGSFLLPEEPRCGTDQLPTRVHAASVPVSSPRYYFLLSSVSGANFCRQIGFDLPKCHSPIKGKI